MTMRRSLALFSILFCFTLFSTTPIHAQGEEAVEYMEDISDPFKPLKRKIWRYQKSITKGHNKRRVKRRKEKILDELKEARQEVREIGTFEGDGTLKDGILQYFEIMEVVLTEDYDKIMDLQKIKRKSYDQMETYLKAQDKVKKKLNEASRKFSEAEKEFAETYDIDLKDKEEGRLDEKMRKASKAIAYYNEVFLILYKCKIQEMYLQDAIGKKNLTAIEQHRDKLEKYAKEGKKALRKKDPYKGDSRLLRKGKDILRFYERKVGRHLDKVTEYLVEKQEFDKVKKRMENKDKSERTKEMVDRYNKLANKMNRLGKEHQKALQKMQKKSQEHWEEWRGKKEDFYDKHTDTGWF